MPFAVNAGARIFWRLQGANDRPVIVMLNGIGTECGIYDAVVPLLLPEYRLLRIETRGHGASDATAGDYTLSLLASDVLAVMDAANVDAAMICGVSLGGMVAMELALTAPGRVAGLVLACTSAALDRAYWQTRIETARGQGTAAFAAAAVSVQFTEDFARAHPWLPESNLNALLWSDAGGYAGCAAAIRDMDLLDRLPEIAVQTLVIAGEQDRGTPFAGNGDRIVAAIPGATSVILPTAHLACSEAPEALPLRFAGWPGTASSPEHGESHEASAGDE